ncbi:MAG: transcriptional regulator [Candidatus Aegiribacteria sp.]|nr:transcriptional regulator [Candidatus Aegiribacteria sp.]
MPGELNEDIKSVLDNLNKLLGHRARLGICVLLARNTALSFSRLKELLEENDGSLGAQLRKLEDEGFISVKKEFRNRKPVSWYSLTNKGQSGLEKHLDALKQLISPKI